MRRRALAVAVAAALLAGACGGPPDRLALGVKEIPSDLALGAPPDPLPLPTPVPPAAFVVASPADAAGSLGGRLPQPTGATPTTAPRPPAPPCPEGDPRTPARLAVSRTAALPPAPARYQYRASGEHQSSTGHVQRIGPTATYTVGEPVAEADGTWLFTVEVEIAGQVTASTYRLVPATVSVPAPGLYLAAMSVRVEDVDVSAFEPTPELLVMPFPADAGATWTSVGTDGDTTLRWDGRVGQVVRVDACGQPVDAIAVTLTGSSVSTPFASEDFTVTYALAPQYGAVSVADSVAGRGRQGLAQTVRTLETSITRLPEEPRR